MNTNSKFAAIIVCGGSGSRMNSDIPKQYLTICGDMIIEKTIENFRKIQEIEKIILVVADEHKEYVKNIGGVDIVSGGSTRQRSVYNGLRKLGDDFSDVLIHDGVRPFVSEDIIRSSIKKLRVGANAVIPCIKIADTIKECSGNKVERTINREKLFAVQTPQGFKLNIIKKLHEKYKDEIFTDDSSLLENEGIDIEIIEGNKNNYKITTQQDMEMAKKYTSGSEIRVGQGFDVHSFEDGDHVTICGTKIPHSKKLKGHSDADVGWHALTDAILGAISEGDIGEHFSDKDEKWKNSDSKIFLQHAASLVRDKGLRISNIDVTIICEEPKLANFKSEMVSKTAESLELEENRINIKATTTEKLGFLGRKEGIAAQAIVSVSI